MAGRRAKRGAWLLAFSMLLLAATISAPRTANPSARAAPPAPAAAEGKTGTVAGTVFYEADPKRSWRQMRYYVKDPAKGQLAEAVVALDGKDLGKAEAKASTAVIDQKNFQF